MVIKRSRAALAGSIEAAALAGLAHAGLWMTARAIFLRAPQPADNGLSAWYADPGNQRSMIMALNLIVIGAIAFLWFVAVIRRRVGKREDRFFGTVFLSSALLTNLSWMIGGLLYATPALDSYFFGTVQTAAVVSPWQAAGTAAVTILASRVEAVFVISATTVARLSDALPRAMIVFGYGAGLILMLAPLPNEALAWIYPIWVVALSCALLVKRREIETSAPVAE